LFLMDYDDMTKRLVDQDFWIWVESDLALHSDMAFTRHCMYVMVGLQAPYSDITPTKGWMVK
jgi:hypothetical protein